MPDNIEQKLGLNAEQALAALDQLDAKFANFGDQLNSATRRMSSFNAQGTSTVSALRQIQTQAESTCASLSKLSSQQASLGSQKTSISSMLGVGKVTSEVQEKLNAARLGLSTSGTSAIDVLNSQVKSANASLSQMTQRTDSVTLSWQTFARVIQTQALIRGINLIRDSIQESSKAAIEFQKHIAEIAAINPERSFGQIAANVRELSDAFNQPLNRTLEAQYQTISDQFVSTADQANILTAANQLAKTGADDLSASAQLLTGALNAYGESSDMAGVRAAQFFEAVNVGRFRMSELGTALGRTQSLGHELGVSLEELQAALATITIGGVRANEASTQVRSTMSSLLKPSDALKVAYKKLGVESGESAVKTWGFQGALEQLFNSVGKNKAAMAQLFPNVRALAGVFRLASSGTEVYANNLDRISKIDQATLQKKFDLFKQTDAEKFTAELNKISNFFTVEFGTKLLQQFNRVVDAIGGANGLLGTLRVLTGDLPQDTALLLSFAGAALLLGKNAELASFKLNSMRGALTLLAGIEIAKIGGERIGEVINQLIDAPTKALTTQRDKELSVRKQLTDAAVREEDRKNTEIVKSLRQYLTEANKLYLQDAENLKSAMKIQEKVVNQAFDKILSARQKMTQELFSASEAAAAKAAEIPNTVAALQQGIADRGFQQKAERFDPSYQFKLYEERARQAADAASKLQKAAKDDNQQKLADAAWSRADAYAQMVQSTANSTGDLWQQRQATELLDQLDGKRITSLKQQEALQQKLSKELEARANQSQDHNDELERMRLTIEDKLKATTKDAGGDITFKGKEQFKQDLLDAQSQIDAFNAKLKEWGSEDFAKPFMGDSRAFESIKREAERALASISLKRIDAAPEAYAELADQLQASLDNLKLVAPVLVELETATGLELLQVGLDKLLDAYLEKLKKGSAEAIKQQANIANQLLNQDTYDTARKQFGESVTKAEARTSAGGYSEEKLASMTAERAKVAAFTAALDKARSSAKLTDAQFDKLKASLADIDWSKAYPGGAKTSQAAMANQLKVMAESLNSLKEIQKEAGPSAESGKSQGELNSINQQIESLQRKKEVQGEAAGQMERERNAALDGKSAIDGQFNSVSAGIDSVASLAAAWWGVAAAAQAAAQAAAAASMLGGGGGEATMASLGGMMSYFDRGGAARGTDTVPAMLTKGEFVVNAHASKQWYAQLVAMNAGVAPAYRNQGGTSVTIGDINVNGTSQPRETARQVFKDLNREIRRGVSALRN